MLVIFAKNILQLEFGLLRFVRGKDYIYPDKEAFHLKKYTRDEDFVSAVEVKAVEILGKFLKEKHLLGKILGKDYKRLNRIFEIAQIKLMKDLHQHILVQRSRA